MADVTDLATAQALIASQQQTLAAQHAANQWAALQRFVDDGRLAIDNNRAENQLRAVAVGRKNWLFAGSFEGAKRAALLYSLVQSCPAQNANRNGVTAMLNSVEIAVMLTDVATLPRATPVR